MRGFYFSDGLTLLLFQGNQFFGGFDRIFPEIKVFLLAIGLVKFASFAFINLKHIIGKKQQLSCLEIPNLGSRNGDSQNLLALRLRVGIQDDLLGQEGHKTGVGQRLYDGHVVIGVHLLLDLSNVADGETVEDVHEDDHDQKHEEDKNDISQPMMKLKLIVFHLSNKHCQGFYQRISKKIASGEDLIYRCFFLTGWF